MKKMIFVFAMLISMASLAQMPGNSHLQYNADCSIYQMFDPPAPPATPYAPKVFFDNTELPQINGMWYYPLDCCGHIVTLKYFTVNGAVVYASQYWYPLTYENAKTKVVTINTLTTTGTKAIKIIGGDYPYVVTNNNGSAVRIKYARPNVYIVSTSGFTVTGASGCVMFN